MVATRPKSLRDIAQLRNAAMVCTVVKSTMRAGILASCRHRETKHTKILRILRRLMAAWATALPRGVFLTQQEATAVDPWLRVSHPTPTSEEVIQVGVLPLIELVGPE